MNYIVRGLDDLKYAVIIGIPVYAGLFLLMHVLKKRKGISWKCVPEMAFCVYIVLLIRLVGIFSLQFSLDGIKSYSILPFIGSSFVPIFLNFVLFVPYGFLLPVVFASCRWDRKKILCVGASTSLIIELLQLFGGRYAETEDLLINTLGAFTGYVLYACLRNFKRNRKRALFSLAVLAAGLVLCFSGIYLVGDHSEQQPDGFDAVEQNISEVRLYYRGKSQAVGISYVYHVFRSQISNCGGHILEIKTVSDNEIWNDTDCFIEILFSQAQKISFENAEKFSISNADRVMYNSSKNILYWGDSCYQYYVDYTELNAELEEHRSDILADYQELQELIIQSFENLNP